MNKLYGLLDMQTTTLPSSIRIHLAPMEGVVDPEIREILTSYGGIDYCVTEFIRVTSRLNPDHIFYRFAPELKQGSKTKSGTPVFVQLLGSDLNCMAENAHYACELGAYGIDINFGCPAKTVNRHDGGSVILKNPERVFQITEAVRKAVPAHIPVTTKVRLGFEHKDFHKDIALAAEAAGSHWLVIHARTKVEAYRPPAHWEFIASMKAAVKNLPIIANGDIWTVEDYFKCREISGCQNVMLGRGLMAQPLLAVQIRKALDEKYATADLQFKNTWDLKQNFNQSALENFYNLEFLQQYYELGKNIPEYALPGRMKQLTKLLARHSVNYERLFNDIKREQDISQIMNKISGAFNPL